MFSNKMSKVGDGEEDGASRSRICDPDTMCENVQEFEMLGEMQAEEEDQFGETIIFIRVGRRTK